MKTTIVYLGLILAASQTSYGSDEVAQKAASQTAQELFGKTVQALDTAGPYINIAIRAYYIGEEIRKHTYPNEEEREHARAVARDFTFITTENELRKCFVDNRGNGERNSFGRPAACEDVAKMLNMLGGRSEVDRITNNFNQACNLLAKGQL